MGRFTGYLDGVNVHVSVYARDASDAQLLAKTIRFLLYQDSGPTLTFTRRQQVEHEAYLTLTPERAGAHMAQVLAAGPVGPARDALLVICPPRGRRLSELATFVLPLADEEAVGAVLPDGVRMTGEEPASVLVTDAAVAATAIADAALDGIFGQVLALRSAGITHGSLSTATIILDSDRNSGLVDMRAASTVSQADQVDRDMAATLSAVALVAGPDRAIASVARMVPNDALVSALLNLQRAALDPRAARTLRGKKALLAALREQGAATAGVAVPKLIEPRRISWVNLALVVGTLVGGWALIGVLVNVTKSWSTITGAKWGWVPAVFVLAQAACPTLAVATVGSVTDTMPFGRTVALEVSNTFVSLAGGSIGALATRVQFFQQQGYDATLGVSSGVLISTASWITKGAMFVVALSIAISQFDFASQPTSTGGGSGASTARLVWIIVIAIALIGMLFGLIFAIPRWRRLAAANLRPKTSEVWGHLKILSTRPRNLVEIFGGEVGAQLLVALSLGAALQAFDQHLSLASLIIVLTLGSMIGGISPVPGGMDVVEAGMILGLTAAGIPQDDAVAAVFVQRLFTAYFPPIWGWFCLIWMRKHEYL